MKYYNEFERRPKFIFIWMIIMAGFACLVGALIKTLA